MLQMTFQLKITNNKIKAYYTILYYQSDSRVASRVQEYVQKTCCLPQPPLDAVLLGIMAFSGSTLSRGAHQMGLYSHSTHSFSHTLMRRKLKF